MHDELYYKLNDPYEIDVEPRRSKVEFVSKETCFGIVKYTLSKGNDVVLKL